MLQMHNPTGIRSRRTRPALLSMEKDAPPPSKTNNLPPKKVSTDFFLTYGFHFFSYVVILSDDFLIPF